MGRLVGLRSRRIVSTVSTIRRCSVFDRFVHLIIVLTTVGVVAVVAIGIAAGIVMKAKRDNTNATPSSASRAVGGEAWKTTRRIRRRP